MAGGQYKHGRNKEWCKRYAAMGREALNRKRRRFRYLRELNRKLVKLYRRERNTHSLEMHIRRVSHG